MKVLPLPGVSTLVALSVAREPTVYWLSAAGSKLYDQCAQLSLVVVRFQATPTCQLAPFQYSESLARWIETSTLATPDGEVPASLAVPQTSGVAPPQPAL